MRNPKLKYLLIPVLLCLWIYIGIQIYNSFIGINHTQDSKLNRKHIKKEESTINPVDSLVLLLDYPDPFLANGRSLPSLKGNHNSSIKKAIRKSNNTVNWPAITFLGSIQNNSKGTSLANVLINGKYLGLQKGESFEDLKLVLITPDSIQFNYKREVKTFKLSKENEK